MYQRLVIAQCNMFRNFEDKPWQDRYFPYRTVRDSGTCWSVPFWSCKSPRTVSRPALHDACLGSICESRAHLDRVILCYYWLIRICWGPARHWHISPLLCNPFDIFKFSFSGTYSFILTLVTPLKFIASHDLFIVRYSTKFCPGLTWTNPYLILVEDSLMKGLLKKRLKSWLSAIVTGLDSLAPVRFEWNFRQVICLRLY